MKFYPPAVPLFACSLYCSVAALSFVARTDVAAAEGIAKPLVVAETSDTTKDDKDPKKAKRKRPENGAPPNGQGQPQFKPGQPKPGGAPAATTNKPGTTVSKPSPKKPLTRQVIKPVAPPTKTPAVSTEAPRSRSSIAKEVRGIKDPVSSPKLDAIRKGRSTVVQKTPNGDRTVIKETDKRVIVKQGSKTIIRHDETQRFTRVSPNARVERGKNGSNVTIINRPNNIQIYSVTDPDGHLVRRYRRGPDGHEYNIIDNRPRDHYGRDVAVGVGIGAGVVAGALLLHSLTDVPPPRVDIPPEKYVVRYEGASDDDVYEALSAPPVDRVERRYTLDEVRDTYELRQRMRRVDLDDINFETGSWDIDPSEYGKLERIARAIQRVVQANPDEVFLIEGYTDAVGSEDDNLTLSDRRAEAVAEVLSEQFNVPPENLTTQGYGEQYLKVDVDGPERANRRVAMRRITPLISEKRAN